jgi:hypothetical protein
MNVTIRGGARILAIAAGLAGSVQAAFVHPGLMSSAWELEYMKKQVAGGAQPWKTAFDKLKASGSASLSYNPGPRATISCGSGGSDDQGCGKETEDSHAVYAHALMWAATGDERYAAKCASILDAYANTVKAHGGSNAPLQIGWTGGGFLRAAEILRYTYPKWDKSHVDAFSKMFNAAYLPLIENFDKYNYNGNWDAVMIEVMISLAVFDDNQALFDKAVIRYNKRLPAYIYAKEDGPVPVKPDSSLTKSIADLWYGQKTYVDGLSQETCRDLRHVQHGIAGLIQTAETAFKQGVDLYKTNGNRLLLGQEYHAQFVLGAKAPSNICGGNVSNTEAMPNWEIAYNHYHNWMKLDMPRSGEVIAKHSPDGAVQHMMWTTLSHHGMGAADQPWPSGLNSVGIARARAARAAATDGPGLPGPWEASKLPAYHGWMAQHGLRLYDLAGNLLPQGR